MPLELPTLGSSEDWFRHARSDLALVQQWQVLDVFLAMLCFHAQQTVEKSLKAVLVQRGVAFPYTHDLARLITLVQSAGLPWPEALDAAATLTVYAAGSRYPGPGGEIFEAEYRQATALAQRVLDWAEYLLRGSAENEVTEGCV